MRHVGTQPIRNHGPKLVPTRRHVAVVPLPLPSLGLLRGAGRWVSAVEQHGGARSSSRPLERLGSRPRPQLVHLIVVELRPPGGRGEAPGLGADPADLREHPRDGPGSGSGVSDRAARTRSVDAHLNVEIVWSVFSRHVTWAPAERYVTCQVPFRFSRHELLCRCASTWLTSSDDGETAAVTFRRLSARNFGPLCFVKSRTHAT